MDVCRNLRYGATGRISCTCFERRSIVPMDEVITRHYIRMVVKDQPRVMATISKIFGDYEINIASMVQKETFGTETDIIWLMHETPGKSVSGALAIIRDLPIVVEVSNWIRVVD